MEVSDSDSEDQDSNKSEGVSAVFKFICHMTVDVERVALTNISLS